MMLGNYGGRRASGGSVSAGSLYEVAEGGRPELLQTGGKTFLMMGNQSGDVSPAKRGGSTVTAGGGGDVEVIVNITNNGQSSQARETGHRVNGKQVMIDLVLDAVAGDMAKGGRTAQAAQQRFGLSRRGVPVGGA